MANARAMPLDAENEAEVSLATLLRDIGRLHEITAEWTPEQQNAVKALGHAQDALQAEALRRLLRGLKDIPEAQTRLRELAGDEVIYAVMRHLGLMKASLNERIEEALKTVRPMLHGHGGDVEVVSITPPDRVAVRLTGACDGCPASAITLASGVEEAIRKACPEVVHIDTHPGNSSGHSAVEIVSPFSGEGVWLKATTLNAIPESGVLKIQLEDQSLILSRIGERVKCFDNVCSHMGMPLDAGEIQDGLLTCPHHGFVYSLQDGNCLTAPGVTLMAHPARVQGTDVEVRLS